MGGVSQELWEGQGMLLGSHTMRHSLQGSGQGDPLFSCLKANLGSNLGLAMDGFAGTFTKSPSLSLILTFLICKGQK